MKRKKLLKSLSELLDREGRKKRTHQAELQELLNQLEEKEVRLEEKMRMEKNPHKQDRLSKELEIVRAQRAKGLEVLETLEVS